MSIRVHLQHEMILSSISNNLRSAYVIFPYYTIALSSAMFSNNIYHLFSELIIKPEMKQVKSFGNLKEKYWKLESSKFERSFSQMTKFIGPKVNC